MRIINSYISLSIICLVSLVACGGGGGGGSGDSGFVAPSIPNALLAIHSGNELQVANVGVNSTSGAVTGTNTIFTSLSGSTSNGADSAFDPFELGRNLFLDYAKHTKSYELPPTTAALISDGGTCNHGGTYDILIDIDDPATTTLIAGDYFILTFYNCINNFGDPVANGSLEFSVVSGIFDTACTDFCGNVEISVTFDNLRIADSGVSLTIHGGFTVGVTGAGSTITLSGTSLYVIVAGGSAALLTNFQIVSTTSGTETSTSISLTLASTTIGGKITVNTDPGNPILKESSALYPHMGTIIITGLNNSSLTITINDITSVDFALDSDGDGSTDISTPGVLWADIAAA